MYMYLFVCMSVSVATMEEAPEEAPSGLRHSMEYSSHIPQEIRHGLRLLRGR